MKLKDIFVGNKYMQFIFEKLYRISLRGMNYGTAGFVESSGEVPLIKRISEVFKNEARIVVFDVGSNDGDYAQSIIRNLKYNYVLHCFEPAQLAFELLIKNTKSSTDIIHNNFGLSDKREELDLYYDREGTGWASLYQIDHQSLSVKFEQSEKVKLEILDDYCEEYDIDHIHFLKMDVEGHELKVLKGASRMLNEGKIDFIQFEFGIANLVSKIFLHEFFKLLEGYDIYRVLKNGVYKIEYNERYEVFLTSNYLAIKKDGKNKLF